MPVTSTSSPTSTVCLIFFSSVRTTQSSCDCGGGVLLSPSSRSILTRTKFACACITCKMPHILSECELYHDAQHDVAICMERGTICRLSKFHSIIPCRKRWSRRLHQHILSAPVSTALLQTGPPQQLLRASASATVLHGHAPLVLQEPTSRAVRSD